MSLFRWTLKRVPAALALVAAGASTMAAQERTLFTWSGRVDREVVLVVRGRNVETRAGGVDASFRPRLDMRDALPRTSGSVYAHMAGGRGDVQVLEHPSARNDYTAIIRITDPRSGAGDYRIVASWRGDGYGDGRRDDDRYDRTRRDRDDDRYDRGRGRDRDDDRYDRRGNNGNGNGRGPWDNRGRGRDDFLSWRGDVDDVSEIRITGRRVEYITRSGAPVRNARIDSRGGGLPRADVDLRLHVNSGRGSVMVVQEPNRFNNYTAIIRVVDKRSGYGAYDFDLSW